MRLIQKLMDPAGGHRDSVLHTRAKSTVCGDCEHAIFLQVAVKKPGIRVFSVQ